MSTFIRISFGIALIALTAQSVPAMAVAPRQMPELPSIHPAGPFQTLMAFGAGSIFLMVFCAASQKGSPRMAIGTFVFGMLASAYGFLQGAWPLGIALAIYSIATLQAYLAGNERRRRNQRADEREEQATWKPTLQPWEESRLSRLFGPK